MGAFDDLIPAAKTGGAFDDLIPAEVDYTSGIPSGAELTQIGRENTPAWTEAPAQAVSELIKGMIPHDVESYAAGVFPPLAAFRQGQQLAQGDVSSIPFVGRVPEIMQAEETPAGSKERYLAAMKTLMDVGILAGAGGERAPSPLRAEPTLAERITQPRVEPAVPEVPQEPLAPVTPETPPAPETAPQPPVTPPEPPPTQANINGQILERRQGILDRKAELTARAANGEQGLEPQLAAVQADLLDPNNPVVHAPSPVEVPVQPGEFAKPGYTAVETPPEAPVQAPGDVPVAETPPDYTPEAAAARAAQPEAPPIQGPSEPVGGNVAGFEKVYGPGEIEAGGTISPEDAWDTAQARAQSGKAKPYGFVNRARTGAITPEEMGDLIYEHHRLVERAAGLEGMPEYAGASQAAKDFASNVLKPAETAWHQKGMVMQIERPVNLNTFTGMDQLMQTELGRGIKPSEAPKFTRMAEDVKNGESEVAKAVERSDARVRTKYAKVRDIPIEEAVARVKQMLKDCM